MLPTAAGAQVDITISVGYSAEVLKYQLVEV